MAAGLGDHRLVTLAQAGDVVAADVECARTGVVERLDASLSEIASVDELVAVGTRSDDPDCLVFADELEEDRQQAEATDVDNGRTAEDYDLEILFECAEQALGFELGLAVEFGGGGWVVFADGAAHVAGPEAVG